MTEELELLRAWRPPEPAPDPDAARRAGARLDAHIAAGDAFVPRRTAEIGRGPAPLRRWAPVALTMAAVTIAVAMLTAGWSARHPGAPPSSAPAAPLRDHQEPMFTTFPRPGQFSYVRSEGGNLACTFDAGPTAGFCAYVVQRRETWLSFTRPGHVRSRVIAVRWPTPESRARWIRAGRPPVMGRAPGDGSGERLSRMHFLLGNEELPYVAVLAYRPTPKQLYDRLAAGYRAGQGPSRNGELFTFVADALREQPVPAPLRAALVGALQLIPGVHVAGTVRDRLGRQATVVTRTERGVRRELLFDPESRTMLGERRVTARAGTPEIPDAPAGTVLEDMVYERRAIVGRLGQRPR